MCEIVITVGAPGCGKDYTYRKHFEKTHFLISADHFFTDSETGEYKFESSRLGLAHGSCRALCQAAMERHRNIYVSNTSTRHRERKEYIKMAQEHNYKILIIVFPNVNYGNIHSVSEEKVASMQERIDLAPGVYTYDSVRGYILVKTFDDYFMEVVK